jgi:hypothetical protein
VTSALAVARGGESSLPHHDLNIRSKSSWKLYLMSLEISTLFARVLSRTKPERARACWIYCVRSGRRFVSYA